MVSVQKHTYMHTLIHDCPQRLFQQSFTYLVTSHLKIEPCCPLEVSNREMKIREEGRIMKSVINTLP